jgi:hypothetical protein
MVGIYAKIKNGLNWIKDKAKNVVMPFMGKIGDFANNKTVQGLASWAAPALNGIVPGLGNGVSAAIPFLGKLGNTAKAYLNDDDDFNSGELQPVPLMNVKRKVGAIGLAQRPDTLHSRIELKALPAPEDEPPRSFVEELD